jgi:hypothetical protein
MTTISFELNAESENPIYFTVSDPDAWWVRVKPPVTGLLARTVTPSLLMGVKQRSLAQNLTEDL